MASADTQLILKELNRQGNLLRKDDRTYNIKKVIAANEKTAEAVSALKNAMGGITETITASTQLETLRAERQFKLEQLDEADREKYEADEQKRIKREADLDEKNLKQREKEAADRDKRDFKIFGKDGILSSALKDTFNITKTIVTFAALGAIAYEFTAGILTQMFPEVFQDEEGMSKIPTLFEVIGNIANVFNSETMAQLQENVMTLADPNFLATIGILAVGGKVASIAGGALQTLTMARLIAMTTPGDGTLKEGGLLSQIKKVRVGTAFVAMSLVAAFGPAMKNYIQSKLLKMTPEEIEQASQESDLLDAFGMAAGGAALGSMFGIKGALVGAVAGFIFGLGKMGLEYIQEEVFDQGEVSNDVKEKVNTLKLLAEELKTSEDAATALREAGKTEAEIAEYFASQKDYRSPQEIRAEYERLKTEFNDDFVRQQAELALKLKYDSERKSTGYNRRYDIALTPDEIAAENQRYREIEAKTRGRLLANQELASQFLTADTSEQALDVIAGNILNNLSVAEQIEILKGKSGSFTKKELIEILAGEGADLNLADSIIKNLEQGLPPLFKKEVSSVEGTERQQEIESLDRLTEAIAMNNAGGPIIINSSPSAPTNVNISKGGDKTQYTKFNTGGPGGSYADTNPGGVLA